MTNDKWMSVGLVFGLCLLWLVPELVLAGNKFEIIGGGVEGSAKYKLQYVRWFGIGFGSFFLIGAIISLTTAHSNGLMLNYAVWKQSGIMLLILSAVSFGLAWLV